MTDEEDIDVEFSLKRSRKSLAIIAESLNAKIDRREKLSPTQVEFLFRFNKEFGSSRLDEARAKYLEGLTEKGRRAFYDVRDAIEDSIEEAEFEVVESGTPRSIEAPRAADRGEEGASSGA